jgi:quercetin dioxygenase-like cupin family protein
MIVVEASTVAPAFMAPENDIIVKSAPVSGRRLLKPDEASSGWAASLTTFGIGGRLNWHTHDSEQILYITEGRGIVATKDKEYVVTPGCLVFVAAGENHWHGATEDSSMSHLNVQKAGIHLAE